MLAGLELPRKTRMLDFQSIYKHGRLIHGGQGATCAVRWLWASPGQCPRVPVSREEMGPPAYEEHALRSLPPCSPPPQVELGHGSKVCVMAPLLSPRSLQRFLVIFFLFPVALQILLSRVHLGELGNLGFPRHSETQNYLFLSNPHVTNRLLWIYKWKLQKNFKKLVCSQVAIGKLCWWVLFWVIIVIIPIDHVLSKG